MTPEGEAVLTKPDTEVQELAMAAYRKWKEEHKVVDTTQVNYQLYMSGENSHMCFLLNVHTGQMRRYSTKEGNKKFMKMSMPWQK